ncbi:MAG: 3'-5' exonuclease [Saprospiraceae bacterium]
MWLFKKNKPYIPAFWNKYIAEFNQKVSSKTTIEDLNFFVVDTETSGLDIRKDHLLSIAGLTLRNKTVFLAESFDCFLATSEEHSSKSIPIHGILPGNKLGQIGLETALSQLLALLSNKILVGHHIQFDIQMINRALSSVGAGKLRNHFIDTAILAQRLGTIKNLDQNQGISLDWLCRFYGLKMHERHTAAGDALLTSLILCRQLDEFESKGLNKLQNLLQGPIKTYRY